MSHADAGALPVSGGLQQAVADGPSRHSSASLRARRVSVQRGTPPRQVWMSGTNEEGRVREEPGRAL